MKVQLSKDPLFEVKHSPIKIFKEKQIERKRLIRMKRMNPQPQKKQLDIQIIDPLPSQLLQYKQQTSFRKSLQTSKAKQNLKRYIFVQQRNLRCLRLQRTDRQPNLSKSRQLNMDMNIQKQQDTPKQINIPKIQQMFKHQNRDYFLFENKLLNQRINKIVSSIDNKIIKNKDYSISYSPDQKQFFKTKLPLIKNQDQMEIDQIIQRNLSRDQKFIKKLYNQKKYLHQNQSNKTSQNLSFLLPVPKRQKKIVKLEGVKSYTMKDGNRKLKLTPACHLLFQLHRLSNQKQKKQLELTDLLKNSYQNRDSILHQKSSFYDKQTPYTDLSPSNQFKLRKLMNKRLDHRLELSKQQVNKFIAYLHQIKQQYHVILNQTMLLILKQVRQILTSGKVMKLSDLMQIISKKPIESLLGHPNQLIINKLKQMMI